MHVSPPPTQTTSGFFGSTAIAPMVPLKYLSLIGCQFMPPSVVLNTPPPAVPIQYSSGRWTEPVAATDRPPRYGPTSRHRSAANAVVSYCPWAWARVGTASAVIAATANALRRARELNR